MVLPGVVLPGDVGYEVLVKVIALAYYLHTSNIHSAHLEE